MILPPPCFTTGMVFFLLSLIFLCAEVELFVHEEHNQNKLETQMIFSVLLLSFHPSRFFSVLS